MKIALILAASPSDPLKNQEPFMPLSLPLLAGAAPEHDYTLIDMLQNEQIDFNQAYDVVGISSRITSEKTAYHIADQFRQKNIKVILGGAQPSSVPFKAIKHADAVVIGEGEGLWPIILEHIQSNRLKHFYLSSPKKFNGRSYSVHQIFSYPDLKNIPLPARHLLKKNHYIFDTLFAARGCPIDCDFCSVSTIFGKKMRLRPIEAVIREINSLKNRYYYLLDDTVFGRSDTYDYYLKLYEEISKTKPIRYWTGQANLDAADSEKGREVIRRAARCGLVYAAVGIESINPLVLKKSGSIKKSGADNSRHILARMERNIRFIQAQGIVISGWFTIGYEEDTIDTFQQTLDFCNQYHIIPVIMPVEALPGTQLYDRLWQEKRLDFNKKINVIHPCFNDEQVLQALSVIHKQGFSLQKIMQRTSFYHQKFQEKGSNPIETFFLKLHKTIFTFILQSKMKKGLFAFANNENTLFRD